MIGALMLAGSASMVSCSDNDDDIDAINETIKADKASFNEQLSALKTALDQAKKDAADASAAAEAAAKSYADAAAAGKLDEAKVYADKVAKEEAKAAVATVKAEAIEEAKALIEKAIVDSKNYTDAQINDLRTELGGRIDGIQAGLNILNGDENTEGSVAYQVAKAKSDLQVQINALLKYEKLLEDLSTTYAGLKQETATNTQNIATLTENLGKAINDINTHSTDIATLKTFMTDTKKMLEDGIPVELNTIHTLVMVRLTSLQYIPNYFIGGIETIYFDNVDYQPYANNEEGVLVERKRSARVPKNIEAIVNYRLNPSGVDEETLDLAAMKFLNSTAITRSGAKDGVIAPVEGTWSIKDKNVLTFRVQQTAHSLNNGNNDVVDIVCLQMPLKGKALAKGETEAYVYSDYAQVRSTYEECHFEIGSNIYGHVATSVKPVYVGPNKKDAYADPRQANTDETIYQITVPKAGEVINLADSLNIVKIPVEGDVAVWGKDMMERAGFTFKFSKPEEEYKPENSEVDYQQFYDITEDGIVTIKDADKAKGCTPVVLCQVMDGDQVVTEAYFRIKIGKNVVIKLENTATLVLSKEPGAMTVQIDAKELEEKVYKALDITQNELVTIWKTSYASAGDRINAQCANWFKFDEKGNYVMTIPVNPNQPTWLASKVWANTELGGIANNYKSDRTSTVTVKFTSTINDVVQIDLSIRVIKPCYSLGYVETPWKGGLEGIANWEDPTKVDKGTLVANPSPYSTQVGLNATTKYVFNVYDGFNLTADNKPTAQVSDEDGNILCKLDEMAKWEAKGYGFTWVKPAVKYLVENTAANALEYYLPEVAAENKADNTLANAVTFDAIGSNGNWGVEDARTFINGCDKAGAVLPHFGLYATLPISVIVDGALSDKMPLGDYTIEFVKPLSIAETAGEKYWTDALHKAQTFKFNELIVVTDWLGKKIDVRTNDSYKNFYNVSYCDFLYTVVNGVKVANVTTSLKSNGLNVIHEDGYDKGELPANTTVIVNANGDIEYQNSGNLISKPYDIYVPVSIEHKWGKETISVKIRVNVHK
ncbi:MAG: hypothetical protein ACI30L_02215 [Muribaculaceae bacterium]